MQQAPTTLTVVDGDAFLDAQALTDNLDCPGSEPVISSFSFSPNSLDITQNNCDTDGDMTDDAVCLFVDWNITPALSKTTCTVQQTQPSGKFSMDPIDFDNPSAFVDPANPNEFVSDIQELQWPVDTPPDGAATPGTKEFRMVCQPGPVIESRQVTFTDDTQSAVTIDSFNVVQTMAQQGNTVNFDWNVTLQNSPPAPNCTLSSAGVIDPVNVPVTDSPGSSTAQILADAPLGEATFTFSCFVDSMGSAATDTATDAVQIDSDDTNCGPPLVPSRDLSFTTFEGVYDLPWPGPSADNHNISVDTGSYMALSFTATAGQNGSLSTIEAPVPNTSNFILSIDQCPGVFNTENPRCNSGPALKNTIFWADQPGDFVCDLVPGQQYFVNIYIGDFDGFNNCQFGDCVIRMNNAF